MLVAPGTVPAAFTVALDGPAVTLVETPRAKPPAIGLQQIGLGDHRVVSLDRDVQVVFERQRDRILKRQVQVSGAQKLLQPVRVRHVDRRHLLRPVRAPGSYPGIPAFPRGRDWQPSSCGGGGSSAANPPAGDNISAAHTSASKDRFGYIGSNLKTLQGILSFCTFNVIVGVYDAASRPRAGALPLHRRIPPGPLPVDQRSAQPRISPVRAGPPASGPCRAARGASWPPSSAASPVPRIGLVVSPALGGLIIGHEVARALGTRFLFTERDAATKQMALRRGFTVTPGETRGGD